MYLYPCERHGAAQEDDGMQIVTKAIAESIESGETAVIDDLDAGQAGVSLDSVHVELCRECDCEPQDVEILGSRRRGVLYTGKQVDGEVWRIRVMEAS